MCGITGILNIDRRPITEEQMIRFNDALIHRGPDGAGVWLDNASGIGLGHRRLAIVDLSQRGKQPMHYADRYHLTYNGEIYNYIELREELKTLGHTFVSDSDAEVLLIAYAQWGDQCLQKLNGMWAFAIWDSAAEELSICVDRFAIKSCVYVATDEYFAFASEVKALLHLDRFQLNMNLDEIYRRLFLKEQDAIDTVLSGVQRIPAGHLMKVSRKQRPRLLRWWNTLEHTAQYADFRGDREAKLRELLESSIRMRMRSDRSFGIPISGGMDSSSVLMIADQIIREDNIPYDHIDTFHMVKKGARSELPAVKLLAANSCAKLHEIDESNRMTYEMMRQLLFNNENIGVTSEGPYRVYKRMREQGVVVSLDGHGADELIAGYHFYTPAAMRDALGGIPNPARAIDISRVWRRLAVPAGNMGLSQRIKASGKFINQFIGTNKWIPYEHEMPEYGLVRQIRPRFSLVEQDKHLFGAMGDNLNLKLYEEFQFGFLQKILRAFDYASMANGVEARTPFLDWRLVCYLFSLPSKLKMGKGLNKLLLRQSMRGILPAKVNNNPVKTGFVTSTTDYYLNQEILQWIGDSLHSTGTVLPNLVDVSKARQSFDLYRKKRLRYADGMRLYQVAQVVEMEKMYRDIVQNNSGKSTTGIVAAEAK